MRGPHGISDPGIHVVLDFLDSFIDIRTSHFFFNHLGWNSYRQKRIQSFPDYAQLWSCGTSMTLSCKQGSHWSLKRVWAACPYPNCPQATAPLESSCLTGWFLPCFQMTPFCCGFYAYLTHFLLLPIDLLNS